MNWMDEALSAGLYPRRKLDASHVLCNNFERLNEYREIYLRWNVLVTDDDYGLSF